jgi:hypothetical protein
MKHPRNTEDIAGDEAKAKGYDSRMQIVHLHTAGQKQQHPYVNERGETTNTRVAHEFQRERSRCPSKDALAYVSARAKARSAWLSDSQQGGCG